MYKTSERQANLFRAEIGFSLEPKCESCQLVSKIHRLKAMVSATGLVTITAV